MNNDNLKVPVPSIPAISPFRIFCNQNFPYIEDTYKAMTNYDLMSLIVKSLNEVIANSNVVSESVINVANAFNELVDYVEASKQAQDTTIANAITQQNAHIESEIARQDAYITEQFSELNLQQYVDNKLDEMVLDGTLNQMVAVEVDAILQEYLNDLNGFTKINVFTLDPLDPTSYDVDQGSNHFLRKNKTFFLNILTKMRNHEPILYFINTRDEGIIIYRLSLDSVGGNTFVLSLYYSSLIKDELSQYPQFMFKVWNIGTTLLSATEGTLVLTGDTYTDYQNDLLVDYTSEWPLLCKGNTETNYYPTNGDPVCKKYVDDAIASIPAPTGGADGFYMLNAPGGDFNLNWYNNMLSINTSVVLPKFYEIIKNAYANEIYNFILFVDGYGNDDRVFRCRVYSHSASNPIRYSLELTELYNLSTNFIGLNVSHNYTQMTSKVTFNVEANANETSFSINSQYFSSPIGLYLPTNNSANYTPTQNYNPATKKYVDDGVANAIARNYWNTTIEALGIDDTATEHNLELWWTNNGVVDIIGRVKIDNSSQSGMNYDLFQIEAQAGTCSPFASTTGTGENRLIGFATINYNFVGLYARVDTNTKPGSTIGQNVLIFSIDNAGVSANDIVNFKATYLNDILQ